MSAQQNPSDKKYRRKLSLDLEIELLVLKLLTNGLAYTQNYFINTPTLKLIHSIAFSQTHDNVVKVFFFLWGGGGVFFLYVLVRRVFLD